MKRLAAIFPVVLMLVVLTGCQTKMGPQFDAHAATAARLAGITNLTAVAVTNGEGGDLLQPPAERFKLGPGDRLEIQILGDPTTRTTEVVGPDGKIYFNLLPGLDVWGLTLSETKARIEQEMLKYMREPPQVSVTLRSVGSRQVWLLGRLNQPGIYPMTGPMGVNFSQDIADLHRSFVIRNGRMLPVDFYRLLKEGDMSQNIYLQPDDFVYLPSVVTREVYVLGAVLQPRSVACREQMSLVAAIADAQGTIKDAYLSHVAVVRGSLSHPEIAVVDYKAIVRGRSPDVLLEPGDIVYVPLTPYHTLERYANMILNTFVSTVAINEGARAVSRNVVPVGVSIGGGGSSAPPPPQQ